jgi:hypothetical protein
MVFRRSWPPPRSEVPLAAIYSGGRRACSRRAWFAHNGLPWSVPRLSSPVYANRGRRLAIPTSPPAATCPSAVSNTAATGSARSWPIALACRAALTGVRDGLGTRSWRRRIWRLISCPVRSYPLQSDQQFSVPPCARRRHSSQASARASCTWSSACHACDAP